SRLEAPRVVTCGHANGQRPLHHVAGTVPTPGTTTDTPPSWNSEGCVRCSLSTVGKSTTPTPTTSMPPLATAGSSPRLFNVAMPALWQAVFCGVGAAPAVPATAPRDSATIAAP